MKRLLIIPALALLLAATAAWAADEAAQIYKTDCAGCHGMNGQNKHGEGPLKGQSSDEVLKKLKGYTDGTYGGPQKAVMTNVAKKHEANLQPLADYIGTFK